MQRRELRAAVAARARGQLGLFRVRREIADLEAERGRLYRDLGRAVYEHDASGEREARASLDEVARAITAKEAEVARWNEAAKRERPSEPPAVE